MAKRSERPVEPFWFVLHADQKLPAGEQSRWRFRPLTQAERMDMLDSIEVVTEDRAGTRSSRFRNFQQARETVLLCLMEVENFPAGAPEKYPQSGTRSEKSKYLEMVEDVEVYALGDHVFFHSTLGPTEKNS